MDIRRTLAKGLSKAQVNKIVDFIGDDKDRFAALVTVYLSGPYRITQRAAWPLSYCVRKHPHLVRPHLKKILSYVRKADVHDAVKRNTVRLLQFIEIPEKLQGEVAELCFNFLADTSSPIAVRVFSMSVLATIAKSQPDLKNEVRILIQDHLPYSSAAFRSRAKKVLKEIQ